MRRPGLVLAAAAVVALAGPALAQEALPLHIGGRVAAAPDGSLSFGWPGVYFEGRFEGTGVTVSLDAPRDHLRVLIDGEEKAVLREPGRVALTLADLSPGEHVVRLEKLTENQAGAGRFLGFRAVGDTAALPPRPRARRIEFIGDSFTVGYGNTAPGRDCTAEQIHDLTDTQAAFGPVVARRLDADYRINAWSGFGVVRNYAGNAPNLSLPTIYPRLIPSAPAPLEDADAGWSPQVIVINLGTNDFSTPLKPGEAWSDEAALRAAYRDRYRAFVHALHARHPRARFVLMGGPTFAADVEGVAAALNAETPGRAVSAPYDGLDLMACDGHPSLADEAKLAAVVEAAIGELDLSW
ncbi:SGNH/GDSL hydrolase family protein [Brevundimonas sp. Root1279]|uniref:SGNH/GDSL hydrolase family protein n=1 Tax=Brevundimonas sp. Root1279 TaxID=1736443 RepID=UPI0006FDB330|nr:SGNH/GDSL hydrolase family protein [Brevundimonas sp. Root1279]KQW82322.1 lipase [Brevundimonas sp. Root1279]